MIEELYNTPYEIHATGIAFAVTFFVALLSSWAYLRSSRESVWEEYLIVIILSLGLFAFLYHIPTWVMENNLYQEPHYALFGMIVGLLSGIIIAHIIHRRYKK